MSHLLWKYYWENDVDRFRRLLAPTGYNAQTPSKSPSASGAGGGFLGASPGGLGTSPRTGIKPRRTLGFPQTPGKSKEANANLGRAEINSRDHAGLTVLLRAASSTDPSAQEFVHALIEHPAIDIYVQDPESGWNALHRSLYSGNVSIARLLLERERVDLTSHKLSSVSKVGLLIKTKDHEGNSPFDVYNATIAARSLKSVESPGGHDSDSESGESTSERAPQAVKRLVVPQSTMEGDELFMFGSNKNLSLGVGDEDDRQYPERIHLTRPDLLLHRFHRTYLDQKELDSANAIPNMDDIPALIKNQHLVIQDVAMSKLHSAILTTDPVSNLYVCGVGRGGRLGLGDENTQFKFVPVQGPLADKKTHQVALGQNHTMAVADNGELWTWGLNKDSQLGYVLPPPAKADEEPMSLVPRQVFGSLKKEIILGVAASAHHSVAHTGSSLYCWGRNVGQLGLMDADSRSLDVQSTPRKVAASLLAAPIEMVSAIDKATICLLSSHAVWVFTNYGYNLVKFPFPDAFVNHNLTQTSFSNRYDPGRREIGYIASGGETIAAVTARGDLFTMQLNSRNDMSQPATSTTNPVKIKSALTQPQCVWDSRKDGVASVGVGEHGSVIICTESGAVWKRVKRNKSKTAGFAKSSDARGKDFKFQRVPYITNCVAVRSSIFGAFAAIRKDSKVMSEEIRIGAQTLWEDVGRLLSLGDFQAQEPPQKLKDTRKPWDAAIAREMHSPVVHEILRSENIEIDILRWLQMRSFQHQDLELEVNTTVYPDIKIPVHGWVLAGRSSVLREALAEFHGLGANVSTETFRIDSTQNKPLLTFTGVDVFTLLNLVVYAYLDTTIPVWKYTREAGPLAHRFRQVRTELMRLATRLSMFQLEAAARLQSAVERTLDIDFHQAAFQLEFFEDADVIVELDGTEVTVHSQLMCQRCPFFEGMFYGRSQGQWLAGRRDALASEERIRVDLKHISPDTFQFVLQFLYADVGPELFEDVAATNIDEFSELVLDVMSVANELMLDRLSQICQALIGKFATTRNIANLLNEISPCSVAEFKDTGLEYICLQLEAMLENHLLDSLDTDLLLELDEVVRDNQLAQLPFARSGRAYLLLHEKYPTLAADVDEERQLRVKDMAFKINQKDDERRLSTSYRTRIGSLEEFTPLTTPDTTRRRSRSGRNEPFSPSLRPQKSQIDLIFDMDDEEGAVSSSQRSPLTGSATPRLPLDMEDLPQLPKAWRDTKGKGTAQDLQSPSPRDSPLRSSIADSTTPAAKSSWPQDLPGPQTRGPWAPPSLSTSKLDLKNIMSETSSKSALSEGLAERKSKDVAAAKAQTQTKISQKERKKQLQMQAAAQAMAKDEMSSRVPWEKVPEGGARPGPWKVQTATPKTSLKDALAAESKVPGAISANANAKPLVASETRPKLAARRTASPDTRFPGQGRTNSSPAVVAGSGEQQPKAPLVPHSRSYRTPAQKAEPTLGLSMADIIGQQKREQELVKEAVAKRSLQEIQEEQAFQEWWDQESRRAQEEEARRQNKSKEKEDKGRGRGRRSRPGKPKSGESEEIRHGEAAAAPANPSPSSSSRGGGGPRGRGRAPPSSSGRGRGTKYRGGGSGVKT